MSVQIKSAGIVFLMIVCISCKNSTTETDINQINDTADNWERIGPGGGGGTFLPVFSYTNPDKFFLRCDMTGAYLTNDGGSSYAQINFPNGSYSFAFDPLDSNTVYAGSRGLNKSLDGGKTWQRIFPFKEDISKETFIGDHADFTIITKKTSLYNIYGDSGSTVHGDYPVVKNIRVDPDNNNYLYFSLHNYFFYTHDGGKSWSRMELESNIDYIYTNATNLKNEVYVFTSTNLNVIDKSTWTNTSKSFSTDMQPAFSFAGGVLKEDGRVVFYALHYDDSVSKEPRQSPSTLWISYDTGKTWQQSTEDIIINAQNPNPTYRKLSVAENDAAHVYLIIHNYKEKREDGTFAHWAGALKSANAGKSWKWVWKSGGGSGKYGILDGTDAPNIKDAWVHKAFGNDSYRLLDVGIAPDNGNVAIVTDIYRSMKTIDGGKTWTTIYSTEQPDGSYVSNGLDVTTTYGIHFDPFDKDHLAISYTDIGYHHSYNGGKSWVRSTTGIPVEWRNTCYWMAFDPDVKDKIWSVWSYLHDLPRGKMTRSPKWTEKWQGGVAISTDGGKSWTPTVEGMGFNSPSTSIVLDKNSPAGNRTLYVSVYGKGVFKSVDDGNTWELRNTGIEKNLAAFELTLQPDGTLFLITSPLPQHKNGEQGREMFMGAVYKSTDGAATWVKLNVGDKVLFPNGLTYDPDNLNRLYLGAWSDIYLSDFIGAEFVEATGGNQRLDLDGGIWMSEDGGQTWQPVFDKDYYVYDITVDAANKGRVYANTFNQGAYRSDDYGQTWNKLKDYDFHWGHRVIVDENNPEKVYLTTFGSSVWHGKPLLE